MFFKKLIEKIGTICVHFIQAQFYREKSFVNQNMPNHQNVQYSALDALLVDIFVSCPCKHKHTSNFKKTQSSHHKSFIFCSLSCLVWVLYLVCVIFSSYLFLYLHPVIVVFFFAGYADMPVSFVARFDLLGFFIIIIISKDRLPS